MRKKSLCAPGACIDVGGFVHGMGSCSRGNQPGGGWAWRGSSTRSWPRFGVFVGRTQMPVALCTYFCQGRAGPRGPAHAMHRCPISTNHQSPFRRSPATPRTSTAAAPPKTYFPCGHVQHVCRPAVTGPAADSGMCVCVCARGQRTDRSQSTGTRRTLCMLTCWHRRRTTHS